MKNLECSQGSKHIRKPTHNEVTHIAFWETPSYQVISFWIVNFSEIDPSEIFTSSDAYEKPALSNYVYLNRERIVRDLYEYLEGEK